MMLGFQRNVGVRESLGIGEFAPILKKIKEEIGQTFIAGTMYWTTAIQPETRFKSPNSLDIEWKSILGKKDDNLHRLIAIICPRGEINEKIRSAKYSIKGIFRRHECKLTAVNIYSQEKWFKKFQIDYKPKHILVEIIYTKNKK